MERSVYLIVVGAGDVDNVAILLDGDIGMKISRKGTLGALNGDKCAVVETVGIKDIRTKALRSNNPCNVVRATIDGLSKLRNVEEVAAIRGKSAKEILG